MLLTDWAIKWGIPFEALDDLKFDLGLLEANLPHVEPTDKSETRVQKETRLNAARYGDRLWRNNNGACFDDTGRMIRYGLGNDSKDLPYASSDLIGIRPHVVQVGDVGKTIGIFLSFEIKEQGWKFTGSKREQRQLNWHHFINARGGIACFVSDSRQVYP